MSKIIRLVIEEDPDSIEITIESATSERAEQLAAQHLLPILASMDARIKNDYAPEGT